METNETIYKQLTQQAAEIFNNYIICAPGLYTANDIAKEIIYDTETIYETKTNPLTGCAQQQRRTIVKNRRFKSGKFEFKEGYKPEDDTREIVCGSFSCSFDGLSIFSVLKKTAAAWKVPTSKKAIFVRETETTATVAAFDSPDTATSRQLKNSVANDPLRPVMGYIFADTRRRCLVSCDGYLMTVTAAPTMTTTRAANDDDNSAAGFLVAPALLKNKTTIKITAENMATNGTDAADLGAGNFPNWYSVANKEYNDAQAVNLGNVWAKMKKTAAKFAKFTDLDRTPVLITGEKGKNSIILYTENYNEDSRRESFELPSVLNYSFAVLLNGSQLAKIEKANTMYLINAYTPAVFTSGNVFTMAQIVNRDGHFENFSNAFTFEAPTTGAPANLLHFAEEPATVAAATVETVTANNTATAEEKTDTTKESTPTTEPATEPANVASDDTTDGERSEPANVATDDTTGESSEPATAPAAVADWNNKIIICSIPEPANVAADNNDTTTATDDATGESSEPATAPAAVVWLRPLLQYAAAAFIGIFAALLLLIAPDRAQQATATTSEPATVAAAVADTLTTDTATTSGPATVAAAVADTLTTDTATATTSEPANVADTLTTSEPTTEPANVADDDIATDDTTPATIDDDTTDDDTTTPANVANDDTAGESSEPATVANDDDSDDDTTTATDDTSDDSDDDGATTSGTATANGSTTTTTTTTTTTAPATASESPAPAVAAAGL